MSNEKIKGELKRIRELVNVLEYDKIIDHAMERLNNRPRKTLGFATPNEVFYKDTNNKNNVALII